ncbi:MAG: M48 family metallopeptidase [Betaproteobacteria bacterium]|nr:M48 family metallopeptidase [Betaproteobacteria bacterium]
MDFFAHQDRARRHTRHLIALFVLAVAAIVVAVDAVVVVALGLMAQRPDGGTALPLGTVVGVSVAVLAVIGLASLYRTASLSGGGGAVARGVGASLVPADTADPALRRLRNVIEEVAIGSGVPVPEIYILEHEPGINAFAAGFSPADAAVCVTQGCLQQLNRDELQGVIAHEFSHVLNGDMRINIRLMGLLFGILALSVIGRQLLYAGYWGGASVGSSRGRRDGNGNAIVFVGIGLLAVGAIGVFFGRLIKAGVSRSRESLADASAVQYTRQTSGIAGALKKIAALEAGSKFTDTHGEEVSHMLFGEAGAYSALFATHPPLVERIRALEPQFDPRELEQVAREWSDLRRAADPADPRASLTGLLPAVLAATAAGAGAAPTAQVLPAVAARAGLTPAAVAAQVGHADAGDYAHAAQVQAGIPPALLAAARDVAQAPAVVLALALSADDTLRSAQRALIAQGQSPELATAAETIAAQARTLHPLQRLPLAALVFPALRRRPRAQLATLVQTLDALARVGGKVELEEYCLAALVRTQVLDALDPVRGMAAGSLKLDACSDDFALVAALVAEFGHDDAAGAQRAFQLAVQEALPGRALTYAPPEDWPARLDAALVQLDRLNPAGKARVVGGLTRAVREDGQVRVAEAELLRVICAALHCPLPLKLDGSD